MYLAVESHQGAVEVANLPYTRYGEHLGKTDEE